MGSHSSGGSHKRYRKESEVIERILVFVRKRVRAKKTHIMYAANLNTVSLEKFLRRLIEIGALREVLEGGQKVYVITRKGERLLSLLTGVRALMLSSRSFSARVEENLEASEGVAVVRNREVMGRSGIIYRLALVLRLEGGREMFIDVIEPGTDLTEGVLRVAKVAFVAMDTGVAAIVVLPTDFARFITTYYTGEGAFFGSSIVFVYFSAGDTPESVVARICETSRMIARRE